MNILSSIAMWDLLKGILYFPADAIRKVFPAHGIEKGFSSQCFPDVLEYSGRDAEPEYWDLRRTQHRNEPVAEASKPPRKGINYY